MKLTTWTIYKGKELIDIEGNLIEKNEFPFVLIRPDINEPNRVLGITIVGGFASTQLTDLVNRELDNEAVYNIFQDKLGIIELKNVEEYKSGKENFSATPIREANVDALISVYNIFIKKTPITFDTDDYSTVEKMRSTPDIFGEMDLTKMPLPQLVNTLTAGLNDYNARMNEIRNTEMSEEQRTAKIVHLSTLQANLIVFYDATVKQLDNVIAKQNEDIKRLQDQIEELKK